MSKNLIITIAAIILIGGGSFYGGMKYAQNKNLSATRNGRENFANLSPEESQQRFRQFGGANSSGGGQIPPNANGGFASGEIISKDDKSITLKLRDGGSKIIFYSPESEIGKFSAGNASDIEIGGNITATGKANQDGSLTAQSIQIRPSTLSR